MSENELSRTVARQVQGILDDTNFGHEIKVDYKIESGISEDEKRKARERRHDWCAELIKDGVAAIKKIPELKTKVFENYFSEKPRQPISILIGLTEFQISYEKNDNVNSQEEALTLIRNTSERLSLHTYISAMGSKNGDMWYSEAPENFTIQKYSKEEQVIAEAQRMIKELQLASK